MKPCQQQVKSGETNVNWESNSEFKSLLDNQAHINLIENIVVAEKPTHLTHLKETTNSLFEVEKINRSNKLNVMEAI